MGEADLRIVELSPERDFALLAHMHALRHASWELSGLGEKWTSLGYSSWPDRNFAVSLHWAVLLQGRAAGGARVSLHKSMAEVTEPEEFVELGLMPRLPVASFNHLFVIPESRHLGIGSLLDAVRLAKACELGAASVVVSTTTASRSRSLISKGFQLRGQTAQGYDALTLELAPFSEDHFRFEVIRLREQLLVQIHLQDGRTTAPVP